MPIYIDSSNYHEIEQALETGWITGITTNPTLLSQNPDAPETVLKRLAQYPVNEIFYQIRSTNLDTMQAEVNHAKSILGDKLVVKIPPTELGFAFSAIIASKYPVCITAIFSATQALIAKELGVKYIAVYINRATRILGDGIQLAAEISTILKGSHTKLLAASIKSQQELIDTAMCGGNDFTLPATLISTLIQHPASLSAITDFDQNGIYLENL